jgi:hypothetical protein
MDITGIGTAVTGVKDILGMFFPDKTEEEKAKMAQAFQLVQLQFEADKAQVETNTEEAKNPSIFVSGWRPFIGWVCGSACAWNWIGISVVKTACTLLEYKILVPIEPASLTEMMPVLLGLLGLGAMRTVEKIQGVAAVTHK